MTDTTYVRTYNNKTVLGNGFYHSGYGSSSYLLTSDGGVKLISELSVSSAVDADTLDGQHGAYYATASALDTVNNKFSSYLPLSGGTMDNANVVNSLNADLLDGMHASHFITSKDSNIS